MSNLDQRPLDRQYTDEAVDAAQRFLETGRVPAGVNRQTFAKHWQGFHLADKQLVHTESGCVVVPHSKIVPLLTKLYAQPSWKSGRDRFHARIAERYLGVSRQNVLEFLRRQETWQLHQPIRRLRVRQAVLSKHPLDHWQMDLIDFSAHAALNNGHRYIVTVMDCFTKFAWANPIKTKQASSVAAVLRRILQDPVLGGRLPKLVQTDNGGEFKDEVSALLDDRGIKQVFSAAYKPTTNGMIERFNGTLKRAVFEHMSQYATKKWNDVVAEICTGYNASRHSVTGVAPAALMDPRVSAELVDRVRANIHAAAKKRLDGQGVRFPALEVGDTVRLSVRADADVRRMELLGQSKGKQPNWSKELFTVAHISAPTAGALTLPSYQVRSSDGTALSQRFYRDDLQKIDPAALMVNEAKRADYSHGQIFNQEAHLRRIHTRRSRESEQRPHRKPRATKPETSPRPTRRRARARSKTKEKKEPVYYEVAEILQQKQRNRRRLFLVRWEGYPDADDWTWEPLEHIKHTEAFRVWQKRKRDGPK